MVELNEEQTALVHALIEKSTLSYHPFKEELLDHICTDIEVQINTGMPFPVATAKAFDTFPEDEIQEIEQQIIKSLNQKKVIMKKVSLLALACLLLVSTVILANNQEPPSISPLAGSFKVTSGFGQRVHPIFKKPKHHMGIDFGAPTGTPVVATSDGVVIEAKKKEGYGLTIIIKHDDAYQTLYAQLSAFDVEAGQKVKKGDVIGKVGSTGYSTAPHLHYEVIKDGKRKNPEEYIKP